MPAQALAGAGAGAAGAAAEAVCWGCAAGWAGADVVEGELDLRAFPTFMETPYCETACVPWDECA